MYGLTPRENEFMVKEVLVLDPSPFGFRRYWIPVYDNLHDDPATGQLYKHYHTDFRFISEENGYPIENVIYSALYRITEDMLIDSRYRSMKMADKPSVSVTGSATVCDYAAPQFFYNNQTPVLNLETMKCPHKGYSLADEPVNEGIVTCPLHSLKFNIQTGECVNYEECSEYAREFVPLPPAGLNRGTTSKAHALKPKVEPESRHPL